MRYDIQISRDIIEKLYRHAIKEYPRECCGIITGVTEKQTVCECENIQNQLHKNDPVCYNRDARTAYTIERNEAERIFSMAKNNGEDVLAFYHSHINHDAYFSETDKEAQTTFGEPEFPDALHIVISIKNGKASHLKSFRWSSSEKNFKQVDIPGEKVPKP